MITNLRMELFEALLLTLLTSTPMLLRIIIMVVWLMVPPSLSNPSKPFFNESTCKVDTVSIIEKLDAGTEFDDQTSLSHQIKIVFYKLLSVRDIFCTSILWYVTYFDVSSNQRLFTIIPRYLSMNHGEIIYGGTRWIEDDCSATFSEYIFLFPACLMISHWLTKNAELNSVL